MASPLRLPALAPPVLDVPKGYGFQPARVRNFPDDLRQVLMLWEPPRKDQLYVVSVDVGDGLGEDNSVIDVTRVGTLKEPDEQVAQWISNEVDSIDLAPIVDAVGRLFTGSDQIEAVVAIECNNHGLVTQAELQKAFGYGNLFIWEYLDTADPQRAQSNRIGWWTNQRTRPIILARYLKKLKAVDPNTGVPDYVINSPFTLQELRTFRTIPGGGIREAEADPSMDAHDDCVMAGAIGVHVASTLQYGQQEPMDQARRRYFEEQARKEAEAGEDRRDFQNTDATVAEMRARKLDGWDIISGTGDEQDGDGGGWF